MIVAENCYYVKRRGVFEKAFNVTISAPLPQEHDSRFWKCVVEGHCAHEEFSHSVSGGTSLQALVLGVSRALERESWFLEKFPGKLYFASYDDEVLNDTERAAFKDAASGNLSRIEQLLQELLDSVRRLRKN